MLAKVILIEPLPGQRRAVSEAQATWDRECRDNPAYMGQLVGDSDDHVVVITAWTSRAAYEDWMCTDHDRIASLAGSVDHYTSVETHLVHGLDGPAMQSLLDGTLRS